MAGKSTTLTVRILADASKAQRGFATAERAAGGFGSKLKGLGGLAAGAMAAVGGAVLVVGKQAFDAAAALEQSTGAVESVFAKQSKAVQKYAANAADAVGLSTNSYQELASVIGSQLKNAGTAHDKLAPKTDELITLGADLAATYGGTTADAVAALSSLMRGETDPIEKYGVSIKQSDIAARRAADGTDKLTGAQGKAAQSAALMSLLQEQTGAATGQAAREADSAAGAQQRLKAKYDNLMATLGEKLLPVFVEVVEFIEAKILPAVQDFISKGGGLGDIVTEVGGFIKTQLVPAFRAAWEFIQKYVVPILKSVLTPVIGAVRAAFDTITDAIRRNREKFEPLLNFLRDKVAPFLGNVLAGKFELIGDVIGGVIDTIGWLIDAVKSLIDWFSRIKMPDEMSSEQWQNFHSGGALTVSHAVTGAAMAGAAAFAPVRGATFGTSSGGLVPAAGRGSAGGGPTYVNVTVEGALDPVAVGRQIDGLIRRYATVTGRRPVALGGLPA